MAWIRRQANCLDALIGRFRNDFKRGKAHQGRWEQEIRGVFRGPYVHLCKATQRGLVPGLPPALAGNRRVLNFPVLAESELAFGPALVVDVLVGVVGVLAAPVEVEPGGIHVVPELDVREAEVHAEPDVRVVAAPVEENTGALRLVAEAHRAARAVDIVAREVHENAGRAVEVVSEVAVKAVVDVVAGLVHTDSAAAMDPDAAAVAGMVVDVVAFGINQHPECVDVAAALADYVNLVIVVARGLAEEADAAVDADLPGGGPVPHAAGGALGARCVPRRVETLFAAGAVAVVAPALRENRHAERRGAPLPHRTAAVCVAPAAFGENAVAEHREALHAEVADVDVVPAALVEE
jgi:hypothetical protein